MQDEKIEELWEELEELRLSKEYSTRKEIEEAGQILRAIAEILVEEE